MTTTTRYSQLQEVIMLIGLSAFYSAIAGHGNTGAFGVKRVLQDHFRIPRSIIDRRYRRNVRAREGNRKAQERQAAPRASISRACVRLARRGMVEKLGRGRSRLTNEGIDVALENFSLKC
jgi:hypothetical protein